MKLLVSSYDYPRPGAAGANRWAAMTRHLRRIGHDVTIITAGAEGDPAGGHDGIMQTADLNSNQALRGLLRRPVVGDRTTPAASERSVITTLLKRVVVPDAYLLSWNPWAMRALSDLLGQESMVDCLITTSPPDSTHLLGLWAQHRFAVGWIADFRDGWMFEPPRLPLPTAPQRALSGWLERRVARGADAVVAVTEPIVDDFRSRVGVEAELITNGWDPDSAAPASSGEPRHELIDHTKYTFVHTGTVSGDWGRDPRPLLAAVRSLVDADPALSEHVEILFVGAATEADLRLLGDSTLRGVVRYGGILARDQIPALQRAADALLLLTSARVSEATGKLFEYLGAGRPIIALAAGNEAARIVSDTGTGVCVEPRDVGAIAAQLRRAIDGSLARSYQPRRLENYSYPGTARRMAAVAERVVAGRRSQVRTDARD